MANNRRDLVNPKQKKGKEVKSRVLDLMGKVDNLNETTNKSSNVEFVKKAPDGNIYGIVRENKNYFIKKAEIGEGHFNNDGKPVVRENDFKYIGGLANKEHCYKSYAEALKHANLKFGNISESRGEKNPTKNSFVSDDIIIAENDEPIENTEEGEEEEDGENLLYDDEDELSEAEKYFDDLKKNGGETPVKESKEKEGRFGILRLLEDDEMDYNDYMMKMAREHFGAKTSEELGQALDDASEEERQDFFAELDKWTSDEEEKYMTEEDEDENNPWAICRAQQNKHGWSDEKTERCIKDVKKQNESEGYSKKKVTEENEEDEDIEDKRYVLRTPEDEEDPVDNLSPEDGEEDVTDMGDEEEGSNKPFDDEPFDADVQADEEEEPRRFIQQLSGKLAQTLRSYRKEEGEDLDLEQFAINTVLSATSPHKLDKDEQKEMINRIKTGSGSEDEEVAPEDEEEDMDTEEPEGEEDIEDVDGEEEIKKDEEEDEEVEDF